MKPLKIHFLIIFFSALIFFSCSDNNISPTGENASGDLGARSNQVNLVSDTASYNPVHLDMDLVNAWGVAMMPEGKIVITANHTSLAICYDMFGNRNCSISIPGANHMPGAPTGVVYNRDGGFMINGGSAKLIFASEDGTISAWNSGSSAVIVADRSAFNSVYKG